MTPDETKAEFSFTKPAVYKIRVKGVLSENCSEILGGMQRSISTCGSVEHFIPLLYHFYTTLWCRTWFPESLILSRTIYHIYI